MLLLITQSKESAFCGKTNKKERLIVFVFSDFLLKYQQKGDVATLYMDTLGYFLYMDSMEKQQKAEQDAALCDIFGEADEDEEDE